MRTIFILIVVALFNIATAESAPKTFGLDTRMRYVQYQPENVTPLRVQFGYASVVELANGENMSSFFAGDSEAWAVSSDGRFIAIKPLTDVKPETNIIIISDKGRKYVLDLLLGKKSNRSYGIKYVYPESAKSLKRDFVTQQLNDALNPAKQKANNYNYWQDATDGISIENFFDNGTHTFIKTSHSEELPVVYAIDALGQEQVVNVSHKNGWVIVPQLSANWRLRAGNAVACVKRTLAYTTNNTAYKTVLPSVKREVK